VGVQTPAALADAAALGAHEVNGDPAAVPDTTDILTIGPAGSVRGR
jgi:hypothetical protein